MPDRPNRPTKRGHDFADANVTSYDTPSALRRATPQTGPNENDDERTDIYESQKLPPVPQLPRAPAIKVKSMKAPGELSSGQIPLPADAPPPRVIPQVKLRAMSEVASQSHPGQQSLGYLAPPRNLADVRARKTRDFIVWGSVCVILACVVALGIWFVAK